MINREAIFESRDPDKIWKRFCGYFDLTVDEFMDVQRHLLEEQLEVMADSALWKHLLNGKKPKTMEEFLEIAPITTYWSHYADWIGEEGKDKCLSVKPLRWAHTSGRGGRFKWIPWTKTALEKYADATMTYVILGCADRKGEMKVSDNFRFLALMAPSPYISGITCEVVPERFGIRLMPPADASQNLDFQGRIQLGFKLALQNGVDFAGAVATALVKMGEGMAERSQGMRFSAFMLRPPVLARVLRAMIISRRQKRAMLPKDLWPVKGIMSGGTDTSIYRERIKQYWGKIPHESYGMTECGYIASQSWIKNRDMTFYPYCAFLEFIPDEDRERSLKDSRFRPRTLLLNQLEVGKIYEVVVTNFYGMPLMRYRPGDLVKITALEDKEAGIKLPQLTFFSRADFLIDLYSIVRLDERTLWQAIDGTGIAYEDWTARKEYEKDTPVLRIYIEAKQGETAGFLNAIHDKLRQTCPFYDEAVQEVQTNPVRLTFLAPGSFDRYYDKKKQEGADLAHLKPPHMNATDEVIAVLLGSREGAVAKSQ